MKLGRTLWLIILAKLFIMFAVLKVFSFQTLSQEKTTCSAGNIFFMN